VSFSLSSFGDELYLFSADGTAQLTGYSHGIAFGAAADNESFGRYINSVGEEQFPAQSARSFGSANVGPRIGPWSSVRFNTTLSRAAMSSWR
jgi:hypothetical protein